MAQSLIVKIITAASSYAPLTALLGSSPFRMFPMQLDQGTAFPAVVVQQISGPSVYTFSGRMSTLFARVQFTVFGSGSGGENARAVIAALISFLDQFNADGITNRVISPNQAMSPVEMGIAQTQPLTFQIRMDAQIFNNSTL